MNTYTVVYKLGNQHWIIRYLSCTHIQVSDDSSYISSCSASYEAEVWGTEITRWGDD